MKAREALGIIAAAIEEPRHPDVGDALETLANITQGRDERRLLRAADAVKFAFEEALAHIDELDDEGNQEALGALFKLKRALKFADDQVGEIVTGDPE